LKLSQLFWETGKPCFPKKSGHIFLSIFTEFIGYIANNIGMRKSVLVGVEKRKLMVTLLRKQKSYDIIIIVSVGKKYMVIIKWILLALAALIQ